jgi:hypothetical protein
VVAPAAAVVEDAVNSHHLTYNNPHQKIMNPKIIASALLITAVPLFGSTTLPSTTDTTSMVTTYDSGWKVRTAMYGWFTSMKGDVTVAGNTAPMDVKFTDIVDKIDASFMGIVEVGKGDWSFAADLFYAKLGASNTRGLTVFEVEAEQFIGNFVVVYRVFQEADSHLDLYAGARVNYISNDLFINRPFPVLDTSVEGSKTWVDPVIGARYQHNLSENYFFRAAGDIGGFGVASDFTWQALAMLGRRVGENSAVGIGYRGLGVDYTDGGFGYDVISHGIILGFEHRF